ncbi:cell division control protein 6 homolog B-like [Rhodamnia argentea]|uniref:Cell division control protein n=1 Tax=Rhodamnia argentea TaxID=178133 RepID=A0A8B8PTR7_9MYRT|nr:cell division control protein 6 homolog B-like [Rhodamnia argentea]
MPSIAKRCASPISPAHKDLPQTLVGSDGDSTPQKRKLRSGTPAALRESGVAYPGKRVSPRRCLNQSPNTPPKRIESAVGDKPMKPKKSPVKKLPDSLVSDSKWNPRDAQQMSAAKEALHVSTLPPFVSCRENEQKMIVDFCKGCIKQEKPGSLYICGCPGTGKSLSMEKVKGLLLHWTQEAGLQQPEVLTLNCTSLSSTSEIFSKIISKYQSPKMTNDRTSALQLLQKLYSEKQQSTKMMLIIADELDYLITKDRAVLHDLFMLTTFPFSKCILVGIANAIDLADRFLPRLQALNCKPIIVTFRAYSPEQIIRILQQRLKVLPYPVFQPHALELCARKVAAASGDMRKALCICRAAIDMLEAELQESTRSLYLSMHNEDKGQQAVTAPGCSKLQEIDAVRVDHMVLALSRTFRSPVVDTIQSLPQHQQIILCSAVKLFRGRQKDTIVGELYKSYLDVCKSTHIPATGFLEFSGMCRVLSDQGLLKLGQSREDKLRRIALKVDEADIAFALQGVRFFRNCLQ